VYSSPKKHIDLPGSSPKWIIAALTILTKDVSMCSCYL
jgi:hypothetical protein